jgi:hypothetical protein
MYLLYSISANHVHVCLTDIDMLIHSLILINYLMHCGGLLHFGIPKISLIISGMFKYKYFVYFLLNSTTHSLMIIT